MLRRKLRITAGLRGERSQRADDSVLDPRLALTWQHQRGLSYSVAGGVYHQVPEGIDYAPGYPLWPAMRAEQVIGSVEWKRGVHLLRAETYAKRYHTLVGRDRDFRPHGGGEGDAFGTDFFVKTVLPGDVNARLTWSYVDAERTDPATGVVAPAPWAVKHSASLILGRSFGSWQISFAGRWATGRAFTPVMGSIETGGRHEAVFGAPNSEHYPAFKRVDCTLVRTWAISERVTASAYIAGFNLFGWDNVSGYDYSADFSERREVPGVFGRGLYFGVNLIFR